jgi:predicted transcriptional regulator
MKNLGTTREATGRILVVSTEESAIEQTIVVAKAIASQPRLRILEYLTTKVASVTEISGALDMPIATAYLHLSGLENAELVSSQTAPGKRGQKRMYTRIYDSIVFHLPTSPSPHHSQGFTVEMPIGAFVNHSVVPTCGLAGQYATIGIQDDPVSFFDPNRYHAQLVWLSHGYIEYQFPNYIYNKENPTSLQLSMELCSEAAPSADDWPSDISIHVNGVNIGTWTSPADFADKRGLLTPEWWFNSSSQYGLQKFWRVDNDGSYIDGRNVSTVKIDDLSLSSKPHIRVRIGVDDNAVNRGGLNLFGKHFGNYAQDIVMDIRY